jgi:fatty acid-binding protein DegV
MDAYQVLMDAYKVRALEIEKEHNALEKSYDTSIYHGDGGAAVKAAEKKVKDLEQQYPVAKAYIYYTNYASKCAGLDSGYQAKLAAQALAEGKSIEEAEKIANNWDKWI